MQCKHAAVLCHAEYQERDQPSLGKSSKLVGKLQAGSPPSTDCAIELSRILRPGFGGGQSEKEKCKGHSLQTILKSR